MKEIKDLKTLSDEELVALTLSGDKKAEEIIIRKYKDVARRVSRFYFLNGGDEEDLLQEGMIAVFKAIQSFNGQGKFYPFAITCIKNRIMTVIRNSNTKKNAPFLPFPEDGEGEVVTPDPLLGIIEAERETELLNRIKAVLSKYEYEILTLYLQGYNIKEISEKAKESYKSVDNAIQRIRLKLSSMNAAQTQTEK